MTSKYLILFYILVFQIAVSSLFANNLTDSNIVSPSTFGYNTIPSVSFSQDKQIGSIPTKVGVSPTGASVCELAIDVPTGPAGTRPQLSLVYNSQTGIGIAGYGFDVAGISIITRGARDIFHEGRAKGITYTDEDVFYIDGKRLYLVSASNNERVYNPEGDVNTFVYMRHDTTSPTVPVFTIKTADGKTCTFGSSAASRNDVVATTGGIQTSIWYMDKWVDRCSNIIIYQYLKDQLHVYPSKIVYGDNISKTSSIKSFVEFEYLKLSDTEAVPYRTGGRQAYIGMLLNTITTKTGNDVFRKYLCKYESANNDEMPRRLVEVSVSNGYGETLPPIKITWNEIQPEYKASEIKMQLMSETIDLKILNRRYQALDINADGYDDIVEIADVKENNSHYFTYLNFYVNKAELGNDYPEFLLAKTLQVSPSVGDKWTSYWNMPTTIDYDGDGLPDFIMPHIHDDSYVRSIYWYIIPGSNIAAKNWNGIGINVLTRSNGSRNLFAYGDIDNDGRTEIIQLEQDNVSGTFPCHIIKHSGNYTAGEKVVTDFNLKFATEPKDIYLADFNGDGLADLLTVCKTGYTIFWNTCDSIPFTDSKQTYRASLSHVSNIRLGDFNGNGLPDLIMNQEGSAEYRIAFSNGDGTFTLGSTFCPPLAKKNTDKNNVRYTIEVADFNHDGRSDVILGKAKSASDNDFVWMYSNGSIMVPKSHISTTGEEDSKWFNTIIGNFTGNGVPEVIHFGADLLGKERTSAKRIYYDSAWNLGTGLVKSITDGMGNYNSFEYSNLLDNNIYSCSKPSVWPTVNVVQPLTIVNRLSKSNGILAEQEDTYKYADLQLGVTGRGLLPFGKIQVYNNVSETTSITEITKWDTEFQLPISTKTSIEGKDWNCITSVESTLAKKSNCNYQLLSSSVSEKNSDGTIRDIDNVYDETNGYLTDSYKIYDDYVQEIIRYSGYKNIGGTWLPAIIKAETKHPDDTKFVSTTTEVEYNAIGLPVRTKSNAGTDKETIKNTAYDIWGNVVWESVVPSAANSIEEKYTYDNTGRFLKGKYTYPSSETMTYEYDTWGNVVAETILTNPSHALTTQHSYDNWGRHIGSKSPRGAISAKYYCQAENGGYAFVTMGNGMPWTAVWYDSMNHKLKEQVIGMGDIVSTKTYSYDKCGNVVSNNVASGNFRNSEQMEYDSRNRIVKWSDNTGKMVAYGYGKRSASVRINGKKYNKTYDAWGNVRMATDPLCDIKYKYFSTGKLKQSGIKPIYVNMEYDKGGNLTSLTDIDAGTTNYEYNGFGLLLEQTDARGTETENSYDWLNRLVATSIDGVKTTYNFGTSGNDTNLPVKEQTDNMTAEREYNEYGEVTKETRNINGKQISYSFAYDSLGRISERTYPNGLKLRYVYDCYGNRVQALNDNSNIWKFLSTNGLVSNELLGKDFVRTTTLDKNGYLSSIKLEKGGKPLHEMTFVYDPVSGNLLSRKGMEQYGTTERFTYDNLDRLTSYTEQEHYTREMEYDKYGRILYKYGVGEYEIGMGYHVSLVTNELDSITGYPQRISYNGFGKVAHISGINGDLEIMYGPDQQRWMETNDRKHTTTYFFGDYERIDMPSDFLDVCYLDGGVMHMSSRHSSGIFVPFLDNLGSYVKIYSPSGSEVFHTTYDPWGKPTCLRNDMDFHRGYCGHEMIDEGWLINMNGRVYDPWLATFLSPDNYIQDPLNSQNYNRYGYCLNNPLKYTDPSGNFWNLIIGGVIGGIFNWASHGFQFNAKGLGYFATGVAAGAIGAGIASGVNVAIAGGNFWTGATGIANGISSTGFISGLASGASAGFTGGFVYGAGNSWVAGHNFKNSLLAGVQYGFTGALEGGIAGGIFGGIDALEKHTNFWTGMAKFNIDGAYTCTNCMSSDFELGEKTITGKYVGEFENVSVFETKKFGSIITPASDGYFRYRAVTIPERGIIAAEGVFTSGLKNGIAMMQHEFGHILQYRNFGSYAYWHVIAPESMASATFKPSLHYKFWTESWANYLSNCYFKNIWIGGIGYPVKNISNINLTKIRIAQMLGLVMSKPRGFI